jgi:TorA maturation chaperone TorD
LRPTLAKAPIEDAARAECYGLISGLFLGRTDLRFLQHLAWEGQHATDAPRAWQLEGLDEERTPGAYVTAFSALRNACRSLSEETIREEYETLFLGPRKTSISPFTSDHALPHAADRHLNALRAYLVSLGLARRDSQLRVEDHISAVCDVMKWLIERSRPIEEQLAFFDEFVRAGVSAFCSVIDTRRTARFYRAVAEFARAFIDQELSNLEQARERDISGR